MSTNGQQEHDNERTDFSARRLELDRVVQTVFAAGLSLRLIADLSTQPEVVRRLEQVGSDLDAIVRHVWQADLRVAVPLVADASENRLWSVVVVGKLELASTESSVSGAAAAKFGADKVSLPMTIVSGRASSAVLPGP